MNRKELITNAWRLAISLFSAMNGLIVRIHSKYIYKPVNSFIEPLLTRYPMSSWLTPNRVTTFRTLLCLPTVVLLANHYIGLAALCVIINDLGDFFDGIVARVHEKSGIQYDKRFGAYYDAVCDKLFSVLVWYSWIVIDYVSGVHSYIIYLPLTLLIILESILFWERTALYFSTADYTLLLASDTGKAKQTIEMIGTALLFFFPYIGALVLTYGIFLAANSIYEKAVAKASSGGNIT